VGRVPARARVVLVELNGEHSKLSSAAHQESTATLCGARSTHASTGPRGQVLGMDIGGGQRGRRYVYH
jgi:hypothetical protein